MVFPFTINQILNIDFIKDFDCQELYDSLSVSRSTRSVAFSNLNTIAHTIKDPKFLITINKFDLVVPDGKPVEIFSQVLTNTRLIRYPGPDFMSWFLKNDRQYSHFFMGSSLTVLNSLVDNSKLNNPSLKVAGVCSPPFEETFSSKTNSSIIDQINKTNPDLLWVGLGCPKQEKWIIENQDNFPDVKLILGVGAAFDFLSGNEKRAPLWWRKCSFEIIYRLLQNPKKMFPRVFVDPFIVCKHLFLMKFSNKARD